MQRKCLAKLPWFFCFWVWFLSLWVLDHWWSSMLCFWREKENFPLRKLNLFLFSLVRKREKKEGEKGGVILQWWVEDGARKVLIFGGTKVYNRTKIRTKTKIQERCVYLKELGLINFLFILFFEILIFFFIW